MKSDAYRVIFRGAVALDLDQMTGGILQLQR